MSTQEACSRPRHPCRRPGRCARASGSSWPPRCCSSPAATSRRRCSRSTNSATASAQASSRSCSACTSAVLIPALLLLGPVADRIGRRPLLVAGIAVTWSARRAFAAARSVGVAVRRRDHLRLRQRARDVLRRRRDPRAAPGQHVAAAALAASVAAAAGLTLGPLVSGLLAWIDAVADDRAVRARHRSRHARSPPR